MRWYAKITTNTLFQFFARVVSASTTFIVAICISRFLGVSSYGDFAKITALVTFCYLPVDFGLNAIFLQKKDATFSDLLQARLLLAGILIFCINLITFFLPYSIKTGVGYSPQIKLAIFLFSFTILTEATLYSAVAIFQKRFSYQYLFIATIIGSIINLLIMIFGITHHSLILIIVSFVVGGIIESGVALYFAKEKIFQKIRVAAVVGLFWQTLPLFLMLFVNLIYFRVDIILLSFFKTSLDVGNYDFAYKFFDFFIAIPLFLSNTIYPILLAKKEKNQLSRAFIFKSLGGFIALGILFGSIVFLAAPLVMLIRSQFSGAVIALRLLALGLPIFFATSIVQWILIAQKKEKFLLFLYSAFAIANIVLNILFIPGYSFVASAIITDVLECGILIGLLVKILI